MKKKLSVSPLFGNGAILQRDRILKIRGLSRAHARVRIAVDGASDTVESDPSGRWEACLPPHEAGGPFAMTVESQDESLTVEDLYYGDVWLLGGQSNMELPVRRILTRFPDAPAFGDSLIRYIKTDAGVDFLKRHRDFVGGPWRAALKEDIYDVSAVGFFFALDIRREEGVPVGLIMTALGGSSINSWLSEQTLARVAALPPDLHELDQEHIHREEEAFAADEHKYYSRLDSRDPGLSNGWEQPGLDDASWERIEPADISRFSFTGSGSVWLRRYVHVPRQFWGKKAQLRLGTMVDADQTFVNGRQVGAVGYQYPPRNYSLEKLEGDFQLTIRLKMVHGQGGLTEGKRHVLALSSGNLIDLDRQGPWAVRRGADMPDLRAQTFFTHLPVGDFNTVINPLSGYHVRGVLFYQGEADTGNPEAYARRMVALIDEWRRILDDSSVPFIFAQLPNYGLEHQRYWPRLRDEQRKASEVLPNTMMIVTLGMGEDNDLHPLDKKSIAHSFAKAAGVMSYGKSGEPCGPMPLLASWCAEKHTVRVSFAHVGEGLVQTGPLLMEVPGVGLIKADIRDGSMVECLVQDGFDPRGKTIRYAWSDTAKPVLYNSENLPASPFELEIH